MHLLGLASLHPPLTLGLFFPNTMFFIDYLGISYDVPQSHLLPIPARSTLSLLCPLPPKKNIPSPIYVAFILTGHGQTPRGQPLKEKQLLPHPHPCRSHLLQRETLQHPHHIFKEFSSMASCLGRYYLVGLWRVEGL